MDSFIGKRIEGRYQIIELIGVGGMANVYRGVDVTNGAEVAVKILREEYYSNEEFVRRFRNESKAIAMMDHPNIVKVFDVCFSHGMQVIVMEYLDGITLKEYMQQQKSLPWKEAIHFTNHILRALAHAHARGVVHRDMKPQNCMVLSDGTVKLMDFGIARFARSESKTLTDKAIGSVHYISPEQARGEDIDQRADLYSVGVMLFEMLTGELPFEADSPVSVALKQIESQAPFVTDINPQLPKGLNSIVAKAMEKDADRRYQTAEDMLYDISEFKKNPNYARRFNYIRQDKGRELGVKRLLAKNESARRREAPSPKNKRSSKEGRRMEKEEDRGRTVIMVLGGITVSFVLISMVFIFTMLFLNNPLEKVPELKAPNLLGLNYDEVRVSPEYKNIKIVVEDSRFSKNHPKGEIMDQYPVAGRTIKENSTLKVTVSKGNQVVSVPNIIGMEETEAYRSLDAFELGYNKVLVYSFDGAGTVVGTEPGAGSEVASGTEVKVMVSMGPESTVADVPNLLGMSLEKAESMLSEKGLKVGGVTYVSADKPYGTIVAQDPAEGSQIAVGGFVNLNVSGGEDKSNRVTIEVPLPKDVDEEVKLSARYKDTTLREDRVIPSKAKTWYPVFEGKGEVDIHILYNDFLYMSVRIDFEKSSWTITEDNREAHS